MTGTSRSRDELLAEVRELQRQVEELKAARAERERVEQAYLPLAEHAPRRKGPDRVEAPTPGTGRILLVDDEETIRAVVGRMLSVIGYEVVAVNDGRQAVDYYRVHGDEVDLVILDMTMPVMEGPACFRALRELDPQVRVVLSTGNALDGSAQELLDEGAVSFVQKPYAVAKLSEVVSKALAQGGG